MYRFYKNCFLIMLFVLIFMGMNRGLSFGTLINLDAIEDAGLYPGEEAYVNFVDAGNNVLLSVPSTDPQFSSAADVYNYAFSKGISDWLLTSAGNIWSADDFIVGESLTGLRAGIYRVSPAEGYYMYDSFAWDPIYRDKYWWELHIKTDDTYYMLGSLERKASADLAFEAVKDSFIDIPLAEGGSLSFWIWDWNSIDNAGGLSFNVVQIPEPSTLILLGIGMLFLTGRTRRLRR